MTNQQILEKAITLAIDGGWKRQSWMLNISVESLARDSLDGIPYWQSFVYSRDFAKALWGETPWVINRYIEENGNQRYGRLISNWQYHLQRIVISDDPIKYLGENMNKETK